MRVLAIASPSTTHFMPAVPLVDALRAAGHDVLFAGQPDVIGMARGAGLPTVTVGEHFDADNFYRRLPPDRRPIEVGLAQIGHDQWDGVGQSWAYHARYLLEPYLELAREWRTDLIVADPLEYASLVIGAVLGVPTVHHRWGAELMTPAGHRLAGRILHSRCDRHGVSGGLPAPTVVLDPFPAAWAAPGVEPGRPIRPVPYPGGGSVRPDSARPPGHRRRVLVSLGLATVRLGGLPLVQHLADALADLPGVEALITLDPPHRGRLRLAPNVQAIPPTPLDGLVDTSDLVIHHGGAGTAIATLMAGLPHLLLPQLMDQLIRCEVIAASGAALRLTDAASQNDPRVIRAAVSRLLDEASFRQAAIRLRDEAEALPDPRRVAADLEELVAQH